MGGGGTPVCSNNYHVALNFLGGLVLQKQVAHWHRSKFLSLDTISKSGAHVLNALVKMTPLMCNVISRSCHENTYECISIVQLLLCVCERVCVCACARVRPQHRRHTTPTILFSPPALESAPKDNKQLQSSRRMKKVISNYPRRRLAHSPLAQSELGPSCQWHGRWLFDEV